MRNAVTQSLSGMAKDSLTVVFLVALMFYQDWEMALIAFIAFPLAIFPILRIGRRLRKVSTTTQSEIGTLSSLLEETFQGPRHVKASAMDENRTRPRTA